MKYDQNPFKAKYKFTKKDIYRKKLNPVHGAWLWIFDDQFQFEDGYQFYYKKVFGKYYLLHWEKIIN